MSVFVLNSLLFQHLSLAPSFISLFSMPCRMSHASIPAEVRKARQLPEDLIRLCVGIEDVDDLLEDLHNALTKAGYAFPPPEVAVSAPSNPV